MKTKSQSVTLREKELKDGGKSLFLDIIVNGVRTKEYLKLHLSKPKSALDRQFNKETSQLAQSICSQRQLELNNNGWGQKTAQTQDVNLLDYYRDTMEQKTSGQTRQSWETAFKCAERYFNASLTLGDVTKSVVEKYKHYLKAEAKNNCKTGEPERLSVNTQSLYFSKFRTVLTRAYNSELIPTNPIVSVKKIAGEESHREYLTLDEVRRLMNTDYHNKDIKNAFLFSCLTGLRISDILKLKWSEVTSTDEGCQIVFRQQKTQGQEYLYISDQARNLLGAEGDPDSLVFTNLNYYDKVKRGLKTFVKKAGITRNISFHCSRHTFATLQLAHGTDLFTVSKLMGHKDVKTTQVYAKIVDQKRHEAMNRVII